MQQATKSHAAANDDTALCEEIHLLAQKNDALLLTKPRIPFPSSWASGWRYKYWWMALQIPLSHTHKWKRGHPKRMSSSNLKNARKSAPLVPVCGLCFVSGSNCPTEWKCPPKRQVPSRWACGYKFAFTER